jgi:TPR repeat protein
MRLLRRSLRIIAAGAVTVAVGVAINQVLNSGRWNLWALAAAGALAVVSEALDLWLGTRDKDLSKNATPRPTLWPNLTGEDGRPLRLAEVTPSDLGVHPSRFAAEGNSPYIRREADDLLTDALADEDKRLIIVEGPRLAGATSTLAQAAQVHLPDHLAAGFVDDPRVPLADMITQAGRWAADVDRGAPGVALWLDGLSPDRFAELARVLLGDLPPGVRMLATLDTDALEGLRIPEQLDKLLGQHAVRIRLTAITEQERRDLRAQEVYAALRPVLDQQEDLFLGRVMVAWKPLRAALTRGVNEQATDRVALLRAVTDWYRVHLPRLLTADVLGYLYRVYRAELTGARPGDPVSTAGFREALQWATAAPAPDQPRLIDLQEVPSGQRYAPNPLLTVIADDPDEEAGWLVADALWSYADRFFRGDQRRDIGYTALARGAFQAAACLLSHADTTVDPGAYSQLASLFVEQGERMLSGDWWRRAVNTGDPEQAPRAMINLGNLEQEQGNLDQARHWYQQVIDTGHADLTPVAMYNLGGLELKQGDLDQARHWYQQAIDTGHAGAAPWAMVSLANLEQEQGNLDQARHWYEQAIDTGHAEVAPGAIVSLANLEQEQGNLDQARHWYQQSIDTGHTDLAPAMMHNLGVLEHEQGNLVRARHWYEQAIDTGHADVAPGAMYSLANLEREEGNLDQARHWFLETIGTGRPHHVPQAMVNLGILEHKQGDLEQARHRYQQAIRTGHPDATPRAMSNLGVLEHEQGNLDQARHRYQQAIDTGHPDQAPMAMYNLGALEHEQGNLDQARHWYEEAIDTGHPRMVRKAQQALRALDRGEDERLRGDHFGRFGYLAFADPELMGRNRADDG